MTGAPLPDGADAIVPVERTAPGPDEGTVEIAEAVPPGHHVRPVGDDIEAGDRILGAGVPISPAHLGLLATVGIAEVAVYRRPRIGVLSTGDELVVGPGPLLAGQIRDSNRAALLALVEAAGAEPVDLGLAPDDAEAITKAVLERRDEVRRRALQRRRVDGRRRPRPATCSTCSVRCAGCRSPSSRRSRSPSGSSTVCPCSVCPATRSRSIVSFELFARPAIRRLAGHPDGRLDRPCVAAVAVDGLPRGPDGKIHFVRVVAKVGDDGRLEVRSAGGQGSHQLSGHGRRQRPRRRSRRRRRAGRRGGSTYC